MEREDGEMSDDNEMIVDDELHDVPKTESTIVFKVEKDGLSVEQLEKADAQKIQDRAKRFGLNLSGSRVITQQQIDELYSNCGIESGNERHFKFDAIYLNCVDGLSTNEIFQYFEDYKPVSLEWIDDMSCQIVCQDHITAALALLRHSREIQDEELKEMLAKKSSHHWREGIPHPKKDMILMRFATNGEQRKVLKNPNIARYNRFDQSIHTISKNPWGDLCKSWGVYDHQEVFQRKMPYGGLQDYGDEDIDYEEDKKFIPLKSSNLAQRLGKRKLDREISDDSDSDYEWKTKSKTPRMRMHADDEESKQKMKKALKLKKEQVVKPIQEEKFAPLSIEVVNSRSEYVERPMTKLSEKFKFHGERKRKQMQIKSRLGERVTIKNNNVEHRSSESDEHDDPDDDPDYNNISSIVEKVEKTAKSNVWSRLDVPIAHQDNHTSGDLRQRLKYRPTENTDSNDLRTRIGKTKITNLRIEIDNI